MHSLRTTIFLSAVFCLPFFANAQEADTASANKAPESWKHFFPGIRLAFGAQKAFYYEAGLSLQRFAFDSRRGYAATCIYAAWERRRAMAKEDAINGYKLGIESVFNGGTGGIEVVYLTNSMEEDIVITPKMGLGIGVVTLFYGYNISTNQPFN